MNIPVRPADVFADIEAARMLVDRRHDFDCSPEHLADVAASYPSFGKASPERKALLEQRERDREAAARAPVGWIKPDPEAADNAVGELVKGHRAFNRSMKNG